MDNSIIDDNEVGKTPNWKSLKNGIILGLIFLVLGFVFKVMHWPGGNGLSCISIGIFLAFSLIYLLFAKKDRKGRMVSLAITTFVVVIWLTFYGTYPLMIELALSAFIICVPIAYFFARRNKRLS